MANDDVNSDRTIRCLTTCLARVLVEASRADAFGFGRTSQRFFLHNLADELWRRNPLHPEHHGDGQPAAFTWGMTRWQAAVVIQVRHGGCAIDVIL